MVQRMMHSLFDGVSARERPSAWDRQVSDPSAAKPDVDRDPTAREMIEPPGHLSRPAEQAGARPTLTREQTIERILELNPSASAQFLAQFSDERLMMYLERLGYGAAPRGREARWVHRFETGAVITHERVV